jgi:hypothetical protein
LIDGKQQLTLLPWWLRLASARKDKLVHTTSLAGRTILIVEDEYLIAMNTVGRLKAPVPSSLRLPHLTMQRGWSNTLSYPARCSISA